MDDARSLDLTLIVEREDRAVTELVLIGTERADEVAETLGQHRDGTVDEVDRRSTLLRLLVDDGSLGDIVAHVGDMHADLIKPVVELLDRECVVEVLGILRVDGAGPRVAEILTLRHILVGDLTRDLLSSVLHPLRVLVRQSVLSQDGVHLHIVVTRLSEHVHDFTNDALMLAVGPGRDLHHGFVICLSALELILRDEDILRKSILGRDEERDILVDAQPAHKLVFGTLQDLYDLSLLDMIATACHHRHTHAVAREG